ncbi:tRNA-modifying protein YgfZ [Halioglobus japonicus]|nr:tRNA-modifying protein YgfZ [Halioglobus japonicus]
MNCYYAVLEQEALLHIAGPDTLKFLQGQTTCDTRKLDSDHALPGLFCTPKGRVLCDFLLFEVAPEHYALRMRRDIRADSAAAFGKYIIFSKAEIDAANEDWLCVSIWGPQASTTLAQVFTNIPTERFGASHADDFVLVQMDDNGQQFECFLARAGSAERLARMGGLMTESSEAHWQAQQIGSGIARIEASTVGEFVPQVLNYDLTGHISFKKGCYTGQEVVARLHYLGKSKRRAYAAELPQQADCATGTALFDAGSGQNVGSVVNCGSSEGKTQVLVSAVSDSATEGLLLGADNGTALKLLELPYALESD